MPQQQLKTNPSDSDPDLIRQDPASDADIPVHKPHQRPKLNFFGSVLYGCSRIIDSVWNGATKVITSFKDLSQGQAMVAVLAITMVLGALGATAAVGIMGYIVIDRPGAESKSANDANAALIRYMNERDDRTQLEREKMLDTTSRNNDKIVGEIAKLTATFEKFDNRMATTEKSVDSLRRTNEKLAAALDRFTSKLPDNPAPMPRHKPPVDGEPFPPD